MSSGYNEAELSPDVRLMHRCLASIQEELEAVDYYHQRADRSDDAELRAILIHNRDEELEHAAMLLEWLRRRLPEADAALRTYLFTRKPVTEIEDAAAAEPGSLGVGNLK
jgi:ferritin-like protein